MEKLALPIQESSEMISFSIASSYGDSYCFIGFHEKSINDKPNNVVKVSDSRDIYLLEKKLEFRYSGRAIYVAIKVLQHMIFGIL